MTFLLSFCEGENTEILESISEVIRANQVYDKMQMLITLLFMRTRKMFKKEKNRLVTELQRIPFSDMMSYLNGKELKAMAIEEVNRRMLKIVKIKNVKQLKDIYIKDKKFSDHHCLKIAAKMLFLIEGIGRSSELYHKFLVETKASIKKKKSFIFKKEIELRQDQIIHLFICKVTSAVEIVNKDNKLIISRFLKTPSSFFLTLSSKEDFFEASNMESIQSFKEDFIK
jgi:hypothetical protein